MGERGEATRERGLPGAGVGEGMGGASGEEGEAPQGCQGEVEDRGRALRQGRRGERE